MMTDELIQALRECADADELPLVRVRELLNRAADRLEKLDERVAIMSAEGEQVTMTDIIRGGL
jgi:hypothetical protein